MLSLDYASIGDNLTRELMVYMYEYPEDLEEIRKIYEAGQCTETVATDEAKLVLDKNEKE